MHTPLVLVSADFELVSVAVGEHSLGCGDVQGWVLRKLGSNQEFQTGLPSLGERE